MKIAPTNRHGFWVQMTLNLGHVVNPSFLAHQAHRDEPGRNAQNANKDYGFSGVRFKVQNGFKIGSLNPVRFMGPRPYIWAWIVNLALFNPAHWRDFSASETHFATINGDLCKRLVPSARRSHQQFCTPRSGSVRNSQTNPSGIKHTTMKTTVQPPPSNCQPHLPTAATTSTSTSAAPSPASPVKLEPISLDESTRLIELEKVIETGQQSFIEVGNALGEIRDAGLYRSDYTSFDEYCQKKWSFTKQHAYRLIQCAPVAESNLQVTSLNQARELVKVPKEKRATVIKVAAAQAQSEGRKLAAKDIVQAAVPPPPPAEAADQLPPKIMCPRAKTKHQLQCWYFKAKPQKRGEFIYDWIFNRPVVVSSKAEFKERVDWWLDHFVTEVRAKSGEAEARKTNP